VIEEEFGQPVPFIRRISVVNYRSIAQCSIALGPLTVLLGFNASGKSNFLDVLRFVSEALETSLVQAAARRGGLSSLLHRGPQGTAGEFSIDLRLRIRLPGNSASQPAAYGFTIGPDPNNESALVVLAERGEIGAVQLSLEQSGHSSRLRLPATAIDENAPQGVLERTLRSMRFYDFDTAVLSELDESSPQRPYLGSSGEHLGRVLGELANDATGKDRLDAYVSALVPGALSVDERREGRYSTVQARFQAGAGEEVFQRESLSEGTVRAAGVLAALFQSPVFAGRVPLVGIEEPETALHPAGVAALYEALLDASERTQVIVTSQSSDLLDNEFAHLTHLRAVSSVDGATEIGEVDAAGRAIVEKGLSSISELHRSGQMQPERHRFDPSPPIIRTRPAP
jgi:predicted ATPase